MGNMPNQHHFQKLILERLMKCWMNLPSWGEELARKLVIENTNAWQKYLNRLRSLKGDFSTLLSLTRLEETVAELTYKKAFEIYGNPLPDIVDLRN